MFQPSLRDEDLEPLDRTNGSRYMSRKTYNNQQSKQSIHTNRPEQDTNHHSHTHLHRDTRARVIPLHDDSDILAPKIINTLHRPRPPELRERARAARTRSAETWSRYCNLDVRVPELLVRLRARDVREERVRRDVEGDAEPEVGGAVGT